MSDAYARPGEADVGRWWELAAVWQDALAFSLSLVAILGAHEMGHYLTARRYGLRSSAPMFIPFIEPLGTLGAFIRLEPQSMTARGMMRMAAFGPFAGIVVAVPLYLVGLQFSEVIDVGTRTDVMLLGTGVLGRSMEWLVLGPMPAGHDVLLHPMAFAAWVGLYVTAFNLVPVGQLDGGHIAYAMFGKAWEKVAIAIAVGLGLLGLLVSEGWLMVLILVSLSGVRHPPMVHDGTAKGPDRWIGWAAFLTFALTFTPRPIVIEGGGPLLRWWFGA
jgi:membrane-associated protease RseP (regulator of RpoE activity)